MRPESTWKEAVRGVFTSIGVVTSLGVVLYGSILLKYAYDESQRRGVPEADKPLYNLSARELQAQSERRIEEMYMPEWLNIALTDNVETNITLDGYTLVRRTSPLVDMPDLAKKMRTGRFVTRDITEESFVVTGRKEF